MSLLCMISRRNDLEVSWTLIGYIYHLKVCTDFNLLPCDVYFCLQPVSLPRLIDLLNQLQMISVNYCVCVLSIDRHYVVVVRDLSVCTICRMCCTISHAQLANY